MSQTNKQTAKAFAAVVGEALNEARAEFERVWLKDVDSENQRLLARDAANMAMGMFSGFVLRRLLSQSPEETRPADGSDLKARHRELHSALDELLACWVMQRGDGQRIDTTSLEEFMRWSYAMTHNPLCKREHGQ